MKGSHFWTTLLVVVAIAAATGATAFYCRGHLALRAAGATTDPLVWLRTEFDLTEAQFDRIRQLHESYSVECAEHCRAIREADRDHRDLVAQGADASTLAASGRRVEDLRAFCESAIVRHVHRCAAEMSPAAGRRYLALVLPKIADFDHQAPPDLRLD